MRAIRLALGILSSLAMVACSDHPDIAGKAIVTLDDEELTLDTGDDGKTFAKTGDLWSTDCYLRDPVATMSIDRRLDEGFSISGITLLVKNVDEQGKLLPNVWVDMYPDGYNGFCEVTATLGVDPHDVDFSAADCELQRGLDGRSAWLVSAQFHVKQCDNE
ncbi:hypothetical protein [Sorangium sp. So ce1151]|uniref:hypothetical protein n=1 Tax=Sorangium sp. So ce1151 TaxID=3133332 RepID=UPI003F640BFE